MQVRELEDCPHFNAGRGSVLTAAGTVEMEACVMEGTMRCGAVSGLSTVANAVSLARLVMERTPHIYLAFDGAEAFARDQVRPAFLLINRDVVRSCSSIFFKKKNSCSSIVRVRFVSNFSFLAAVDPS